VALIKSTNSTRLLKDAIVLDMGDLGQQAERLIAASKDQAARLLSEARREANELVSAADAKGFEQGLQRSIAEGNELGFQSGRTEAIQRFTESLDQLTTRWSESLNLWNHERQRMLDEAREDVIRFAFELSQRVVHRIAAGDPTIIQDQLRESLALLTRPSALRISLNPRDRELAEQVLPELVKAIGESAHASLHDDSSIEPGGCVITTAAGHIDASIRTQLDRIAEVLVPDRSPSPTSDERSAETSTDGVDRT